MSERTYAHGDGCCACKCTEGEIGVGGCCLVVCCGCISHYQAAEDIGESGMLGLCMALFGCACCHLMMLGQKVEEKREIKIHDGCWHCMHSYFDLCTCHTCRVVNECALYKKEGAAGGAPAAVQMSRT